MGFSTTYLIGFIGYVVSQYDVYRSNLRPPGSQLVIISLTFCFHWYCKAGLPANFVDS